MSTLVKILPPLHQSDVEIAACPLAYVEIKINGKEQPDSIPSERGSEIHRIMSQYVDHCTRLKIASDWNHFNKIAAAAGPVAGPILDGIRDSYQVDWEHVYGTEITLALDEGFRPVDHHGTSPLRANSEAFQTLSPEPAAYEGTLDAILISDDATRAKIVDYKSHPAVFEADTFQSVLYPFMLFKHLPKLESITFELVFVRYKNCTRALQWKRTDMPEMQATVSRARERQRITHENPDEALALPCTVCTYCPLAKTLTCPIAEWNEHTALKPEDRLRWKVWLKRMTDFNNPILRAWAEVHGPVSYKDGNGRIYEFGEMPVPETRYPLDRTSIQALEDYKTASGEDLLNGRLNISSTKLKGLLKTQKRESLREIFEESIIETATKPKYAVRTPDGVEQDYNPYAEE